MRSPLEIWSVTSPFGWRTHPVTGKMSFHNGVDLRSREGAPIRAPFPGTITYNKTKAGGKQAFLRHPAGLRAGFAHMSKYADGLTNGASVDEGQVIGYVGATGQVTGPHLHYTLSVEDAVGGRSFIDPERVVY